MARAIGTASTPKRLASAVLAVALAMVLAVPARPAHADVWGFVDAKGVAHFASEQLDDRYELFFRSAETFDTRLDPPPPEPSTPTVMPLPAPPPPTKLLAFFDASPTFLSVRQHLRDASSDQNIDYELLQALIATESGFDTTAVSPKGAIGLMQLMPDTARRYGVDSDRHAPLEKKLTDPRINIKTGTRYLRDLINMFPGQLELALAAYNAGEGAVMRYGRAIPPYPETRQYVARVMERYQALRALQ